MSRLVRYYEQPPQGWPDAPCWTWDRDHPAHGWVGPVSGRLYWCGPSARAWAASIMEGARDAQMEDLRNEWRGNDHAAGGAAGQPVEGHGA